MKVFLDQCLYSPFDFPHFQKSFTKNKIIQVRSPNAANLILSSYLSTLKKWITKFGSKRKYLLWTHEPYHDWTTKPTIKVGRATVHIMNCYTRDVFTHNFRYFYFRNFINWQHLTTNRRIRPQDLVLTPDSPQPQIVVLSTYYPKSYYAENRYTLLPKRYQVIEEGYRRGLIEVHGKNWKKHSFIRAVDCSRNDPDRRESKKDILSRHRFNICIENTNYPYYVTEKIWEPIKHGLLPIYYANSTIYQVFDPESFIDLKDFHQTESDLDQAIKNMYDYLQRMTEKEYLERYVKCVQAFNRVITDKKNHAKRHSSKNHNINYLEYDTCYQELLKKIKSI